MAEEDRTSRVVKRFVPVRLRGTDRPAPTPRHRLAQVAALAAVVICLVGAWGVVRNPFGESPVHAGRTIAMASVKDGGTGPGGTEVSGPQRATPVPHDFDLWSLSGPHGRRLTGLGGVRCGAEVCPALVSSSDGGHSWRRLHTFTHVDSSGYDAAAQSVVQPAGALSEVTFVSERIGYVFGGDLWVTTDGGVSFSRIAHPGVTVLDVRAQGRDVDVLTAQGCAQGVCSGRLQLTRLTPGRTSVLPDALAGVTPSTGVYAASLAGAGGDDVVLTQGAPGSAGESPGAWRRVGGSLVALSSRSLCHGRDLLTASEAASGHGFVGLCDAAPAPASTTYSSLRSGDGGRTWRLQGSGNLSLPTQGRVTVATNDGTHLVVTTGGPRTAADGTNRSTTQTSLLVSTDGGRTWKASARTPSDPAGGFDAVTATGDHGFVAVTHHGHAYWRSGDDGASWQQVTIDVHGG